MSRTTSLWLVTTVARLRALLGEDIDEDEQKRRFYKALLHVPWLRSGVRGAILRELGSSLREEQGRYARGHAQILRHLIKQEETRIRESGERPRGGISNAATVKVAERFGMEPETMTKQIRRRLKPKEQVRRHK
jgi:hypothetical protein